MPAHHGWDLADGTQRDVSAAQANRTLLGLQRNWLLKCGNHRRPSSECSPDELRDPPQHRHCRRAGSG
ncbi:hypothetical protein, partial [Xanthomonas perforans]|uniref:hypothetical protein n=1 Tax=Xanthomonas perforans TaxID=442694 RepID=UPI0019D1B49B